MLWMNIKIKSKYFSHIFLLYTIKNNNIHFMKIINGKKYEYK